MSALTAVGGRGAEASPLPVGNCPQYLLIYGGTARRGTAGVLFSAFFDKGEIAHAEIFLGKFYTADAEFLPAQIVEYPGVGRK